MIKDCFNCKYSHLYDEVLRCNLKISKPTKMKCVKNGKNNIILIWGRIMKFVLELDEKLMIKYARHLEYDENELNDINENESFKSTIIDVIENTIDMIL